MGFFLHLSLGVYEHCLGYCSPSLYKCASNVAHVGKRSLDVRKGDPQLK